MTPDEKVKLAYEITPLLNGLVAELAQLLPCEPEERDLVITKLIRKANEHEASL